MCLLVAGGNLPVAGLRFVLASLVALPMAPGILVANRCDGLKPPATIMSGYLGRSYQSDAVHTLVIGGRPLWSRRHPLHPLHSLHPLPRPPTPVAA